MLKKTPNKWSESYDKCVECQTTQVTHYAKGKCFKCYRRFTSVKYLEKIKTDPERFKRMRQKQYAWNHANKKKLTTPV